MISGQREASVDNKRSPKQPTVAGGSRAGRDRGRYFTIAQVADAYPVMTPRLVRRLVQQRRIAFSRVGRCIVLAEADIEAYIESNRVEPPAPRVAWSTIR